MGMNLDMTGVYHQPFVIRVIYQQFKQSFPDPTVTPPAKATMRIFPVSVIWRQIAPRSPRPDDPKYGVNESSIVSGITAPSPFTPWQVRFKQVPYVICYVVTPVNQFHLLGLLVNCILYEAHYIIFIIF